MNQQVATIPPPEVTLPSSATEMLAFAKEIASATLLPIGFQRSPGNIVLAMMFCRHFRLDFFMAIQHLAVVRNRLMVDGQLTGAMLNSSGVLADRLSYTFAGEGDDRTITVRARLATESEPREIKLTVKAARTENENWRKQPDQQLVYAGNRVWGRRHTPEILLGLAFEGEPIDVTPSTVRTHQPAIDHDPETGEVSDETQQSHIAQPETADGTVVPVTIEPIPEAGAASEAWRQWGMKLIAYIRASTNLEKIDKWIDVNSSPLAVMQETAPTTYKMFERAVALHRSKYQSTPT